MGDSHERSQRPSFQKRLEQVIRKRRDALIRVTRGCGLELWAEDPIQNSWMKVQLGDVRPKVSLATDDRILKWFVRVVRNEARNLRCYEDRRECETLEEVPDVAVVHPEDSDPLLEVLVAEAVDALPAGQKQVAEFRLRGYTLRQIADKTNRSLGTVKQHWHRAKQKLVPRLSRHLLKT